MTTAVYAWFHLIIFCSPPLVAGSSQRRGTGTERARARERARGKADLLRMCFQYVLSKKTKNPFWHSELLGNPVVIFL
jgi:hypothetical protein